MEAVLTFGLVSVILGTASGAQNVGVVGALGVGGYIALAGLWGSPISGASMNPARTFGPTLVSMDFNSYWVYVAGPIAGAVIAVGAAFVLRGRGGGRSGSGGRTGRAVHRGRQSRQLNPRQGPCLGPSTGTIAAAPAHVPQVNSTYRCRPGHLGAPDEDPGDATTWAGPGPVRTDPRRPAQVLAKGGGVHPGAWVSAGVGLRKPLGWP